LTPAGGLASAGNCGPVAPLSSLQMFWALRIKDNMALLAAATQERRVAPPIDHAAPANSLEV
jgi:hypothetical protein